jgi:hypothetical protein
MATKANTSVVTASVTQTNDKSTPKKTSTSMTTPSNASTVALSGANAATAITAAGSSTASANSMTPHKILMLKNKLLTDLTHAIQLVQKAYLEKENKNGSQSEHEPLTNSDYHVHELCQQFDLAFLFG